MSNIFIRHGEVENPKDIYYVNVPGYKLSKNGEAQAEQVGFYLKDNSYNYNIITSPLLRARQTGSIIARILGTAIMTHVALYEWMGPIVWRGLRFDEIVKDNIPEVEEEHLDVYKRVKKIDNQFNKTIFISHQDTIRSFTYFTIKDLDVDFHKYKPSHCEVQSVNYEKKIIEQIFIPN